MAVKHRNSFGHFYESYQHNLIMLLNNVNNRKSSNGIGQGKHRVKRLEQLIIRICRTHGDIDYA